MRKLLIQFGRDGLWYKLNMCGVHKTSKVYNIIVTLNTYENVNSCVFSGNVKSNYFTSKAGVRQGENSSLLFAFFINDLECYLLANGINYIDLKYDVANNFVKLFVLCII